MNRRQKIIVSVVGIFIVLLALVGLTYAYFLTQIKGNTNNKSISVTTANLRLVYGGDDGSIIGDNEIIEPDTTFAPKTFTVTNEGNEKIDAYAVVIENFGVYYNEDSTIINENNVEVPVYANQVTTLSRPEDFEIVITCKNQDNEDCTGYNGALPTESAIMLTNSIEVDEVQTYTATLTYKEAGTNQSADMNKRIEGKFNIIGLSDTVDLTGTVSSYQKGDYVQTNSTKRVSAINPDGTYKVLGLEAGKHKIKVCAADPEHPEVKDCADEDAKLIQEINIVQGETASGNNTTKTITITEDSREATVNVNVTNSSVTIEEEVKDIVKPPLLADVIINRAKNVSLSDAQTKKYAKFYDETFADNGNPWWGEGPAVVIDDEWLTEIMTTIDDDYTDTTGNKSYFYAGNVSDNYVNFAGMCWRIVRVQGDGSTKIILDDQYAECDDTESNDKNNDNIVYTGAWDIPVSNEENAPRVGNFGYNSEKYPAKGSVTGKTYKTYFMDYLNPSNDSKPTSMSTAFKNFQNNFTKNEISSLKYGDWCFDDRAFDASGNLLTSDEIDALYKDVLKFEDGPIEGEYGFIVNDDYINASDFDYGSRRSSDNFNISIKCGTDRLNYWDSEKTPMYVGTLTIDEWVNTRNAMNNDNNKTWWTLSADNFSGTGLEAFIYKTGELSSYIPESQIFDQLSFRPVVILNNKARAVTNSDTTTYGELGTQSNPYVID